MCWDQRAIATLSSVCYNDTRPRIVQPSLPHQRIWEPPDMKFFEQVYAVVRCIPQSRVATYGQVAHVLGQPHAARTVGWALRGLPSGSDVPWHRVVNAGGCISLKEPAGAQQQRRLLEAEGIEFAADGCISLERFGWEGLSWPEIRELLEQRGDR